MASPPTADDYEHIVTAAEAASHFSRNPLSPAVDFDDLDDLIFHHLEERQAADNLLKAAETEYRPARALSPTEYYHNVRSWKTMDSGKVQELSSLATREGNPTVNGNPPANGMENPFAKTEMEDNTSITQMPTVTSMIRLQPDRGSSSSTAILREQVSGALEEDFASLIELTIPDNGKKAVVHEHLLCEVSNFFAARRAASSNSILSNGQRMSYPVRDYSPNIEWGSLLTFVNWIYFNKLYDHAEYRDETRSPEWSELLDLYFLAVKWEIPVLKNLLLDVLIEAFRARVLENEEFPCDYTKSIYEHTKPDDPLRRLWIDFYMTGMSGAEFGNEIKSDELDVSFVKDLALAFIVGGFDRDQPPLLDEPTAYHIPSRETGICCCRARFEGAGYEHKCDFTRRSLRDLEAAHMRIRDLEYDLNRIVGEKDEDISAEKAKIKDLETQLSQLRKANTPTQDQAKKIADLENAARRAQTTISQNQSARDREANAAKARITSLENQLRAKMKEVDDQKQEFENAKKRKVDSDWRSGR